MKGIHQVERIWSGFQCDHFLCLRRNSRDGVRSPNDVPTTPAPSPAFVSSALTKPGTVQISAGECTVEVTAWAVEHAGSPFFDAALSRPWTTERGLDATEIALPLEAPGGLAQQQKVLTMLARNLELGEEPGATSDATAETLFVLLAAADAALLPGLKRACERSLRPLLELANFSAALELAVAYGAETLVFDAAYQAVINFEMLLDHGDVQQLDPEALSVMTLVYKVLSRCPVSPASCSGPRAPLEHAADVPAAGCAVETHGSTALITSAATAPKLGGNATELSAGFVGFDPETPAATTASPPAGYGRNDGSFIVVTRTRAQNRSRASRQLKFEPEREELTAKNTAVDSEPGTDRGSLSTSPPFGLPSPSGSFGGSSLSSAHEESNIPGHDNDKEMGYPNLSTAAQKPRRIVATVTRPTKVGWELPPRRAESARASLKDVMMVQGRDSPSPAPAFLSSSPGGAAWGGAGSLGSSPQIELDMPSGVSGVGGWILTSGEKKLSQKQRRKAQRAAAAAAAAAGSGLSLPPSSQSWSAVSLNDGGLTSPKPTLADIMASEEEARSRRPTSPSWPHSGAASAHGLGTGRPGWHANVGSVPFEQQPMQPVRFTSILEGEVSRKRAESWSSSKPLAVIQQEEQAMHEIAALYDDPDQEPEELVSVQMLGLQSNGISSAKYVAS